MTHSPDHELLLNKMVTALKERGLHQTALTLLEAGLPLTFIGGQLLWLAQPALSLLWPATKVGQMAQLLEDPRAVSRLMNRLAADEVTR